MDLAVRTTASPAAIWAIVIVAVVFLAFWLVMVMVYANRPDPRFRQLAARSSPVLGLAADRPAAGQVPAQRGPAAQTEAPTEPIPAQRAASGGALPADTEPAGAASANVVDGPSTT